MNTLSRSSLAARIAIAFAFAVAGSAALAKISECQADCERRYKSCSASGRMTEQGCRTELEKCRKACNKKAAAGNAG